MTEFKSLVEFAAFARERALLTEMARKEYEHTGGSREWEDEYLNPDPNEEDCRFCRAMATCPAMARKVQATIGAEFSAITEGGTDLVVKDEDKLAQAMSATGMIEDWIKAVRAEVERRLLAGTPVAGWGLELGREGARRWSDPEDAERMLREQFRLTVEQAYDLSVISPTTAEKLTKGEKPIVGPKQWTKLQKLIVRSPPKPSVKPAVQIKKPYVIGDQTPTDEFTTVVEDDIS